MPSLRVDWASCSFCGEWTSAAKEPMCDWCSAASSLACQELQRLKQILGTGEFQAGWRQTEMFFRLFLSFREGGFYAGCASAHHGVTAWRQVAGMGQEQVEATSPSGAAGFSSGLALRRGPRRRSASGCGGGPVPARGNGARALSGTAEGAGSAASQVFVLVARRASFYSGVVGRMPWRYGVSNCCCFFRSC